MSVQAITAEERAFIVGQLREAGVILARQAAPLYVALDWKWQQSQKPPDVAEILGCLWLLSAGIVPNVGATETGRSAATGGLLVRWWREEEGQVCCAAEFTLSEQRYHGSDEVKS